MYQSLTSTMASPPANCYWCNFHCLKVFLSRVMSSQEAEAEAEDNPPIILGNDPLDLSPKMLKITVTISQNSPSDSRKIINAIINMSLCVTNIAPDESYSKQLTHPFLPSLTHRPVWNVIALIISVIYLLECVYKISRLFITIH